MLKVLYSYTFQNAYYYTWQYSNSGEFYVDFGVAFGLYLFHSMVANIQEDMNELRNKADGKSENVELISGNAISPLASPVPTVLNKNLITQMVEHIEV